MDLFTFAGTEITADADILSKFTSGEVGGSGWSFDPTGGVKGVGALVCVGDDTPLTIRLRAADLTGDKPDLRFSFWYEGIGVPTLDQLVRWGDTAKNDSQHHWLRLDSDGTLSTFKSYVNASYPMGSGLINIHDGTPHFIQVELINGTNGSSKVWVDGVLDIAYSGGTYNVPGDNQPHIDFLTLFAANNGSKYSHLKIWDDSPGGLVGDIGVQTPYIFSHTISASGDVGSFTVHGATNDWEAVDETGMHDGDTSYLEGYNGDQVLLQKDVLPANTIAVLSTTVEAVAKCESGSAIEMDFLQKILGGSTVEMGTHLVSGNDQYSRYEYSVAGLSVANVDTLQLGVKLTAVP